jgi:hypothetical protein
MGMSIYCYDEAAGYYVCDSGGSGGGDCASSDSTCTPKKTTPKLPPSPPKQPPKCPDTKSKLTDAFNRIVAGATGALDVVFGFGKVGLGSVEASGSETVVLGLLATYHITNGTGQLTAGIKSFQYAVTGNSQYQSAADWITARTTFSGAAILAKGGSPDDAAFVGSLENSVPTMVGSAGALEKVGALIQTANGLKNSGSCAAGK